MVLRQGVYRTNNSKAQGKDPGASDPNGKKKKKIGLLNNLYKQIALIQGIAFMDQHSFDVT